MSGTLPPIHPHRMVELATRNKSQLPYIAMSGNQELKLCRRRAEGNPSTGLGLGPFGLLPPPKSNVESIDATLVLRPRHKKSFRLLHIGCPLLLLPPSVAHLPEVRASATSPSSTLTPVVRFSVESIA